MLTDSPGRRRLTLLLRVLWAAGVAAVIVGSVLSAGSAPIRALSAVNINDKVLHFTAYAVLALLPALHERRRTVIRMAMSLVLLGVLLECAQRLSPGRSFEFGDMAANSGGVMCALLARETRRKT